MGLTFRQKNVPELSSNNPTGERNYWMEPEDQPRGPAAQPLALTLAALRHRPEVASKHMLLRLCQKFTCIPNITKCVSSEFRDC